MKTLLTKLIAGFLSISLAVMPVLSQASETITYFHNDAAGSPQLATDKNGNVLWKETYRPYGEQLTKAPASNANSQWFTGKPYDQNTGLSYFGARYYNPLLGRFMGIDPVEPSVIPKKENKIVELNPNDLHSFNRYAYGNNNPYRFIDPDGREVVFTGNEKTQAALKEAYARVKSTTRGELLTRILERSPDTYKIKGDVKQDAFYDPRTKTINVDPNYHPVIQTTAGPQPGPTDANLGHEIGHAATGTGDRGPDKMDNIKQNENPIRDALGYPRRIAY